MGTGARAYVFKSSKASNTYYGHRSHEHSAHLETLINKSYLPHEWIVFEFKNLSKEDARNKERELIAEYKPLYNRSPGIKQLKFDLKDIKRIKQLRKEGLFYSEIAKEMSCSQMVAHRIVNDLSPRYKELLNGEI